MSGECFEHDLQWYSGGIECPLCALTSERDRSREAAILLMTQYDSLDDFVMGGNLTNEPFIMFRAALDKDA